MRKLVNLINVGRMGYQKAYDLQKQIKLRHSNENISNPNTLILVEHDPVYTIGIRQKEYSLDDEKRLKLLGKYRSIKISGAEFYRSDRGGLITFHGPGQLVAYPIINLKTFNLTVKKYVQTIENTAIELLTKLNIKGETCEHPGVWVGNNKICAIGIHASNFITTHGLALNCNTDLKWFRYIVPCGIEGRGVTSISEEIKKDFTIEQTTPLFIESFQNNFHCQLVEEKLHQVSI